MSATIPSLQPSFSTADAAPFESFPSGAGSAPAPAFAAPSDGVAVAPQGPFGWGGPSFGGLYGGSSSGSTGLGGFAAIMNGFMNVLSSALASLGNLFGVTPASGGPGGGAAGAETCYANATATSTGDPHDAFTGTNALGARTSRAWNDEGGHADLLSSDSFGDGYRVSTSVTAPNARGATYNGSATVATDGGATSVTMNANGSYAIAENGVAVTPQVGRPVSLGGTESVTLGADGSLTVSDANASGATIATTLAANGDGGVDVTAQAANADLGGYLVHGRAEPVAGPIPYRPVSFASSSAAAAPLGTFTTQGAASDSYGEVARLLAQDAAF